MIDGIKNAKTLIDLIYALEPICYYFNMKPYEFWNSSYKEVNVYAQSNLCHITDRFKQEIQLQEAVTNKMIMADAMSNKRPKVVSLQETFESLFPKKDDIPVSAEEIKVKMRSFMKSNS